MAQRKGMKTPERIAEASEHTPSYWFPKHFTATSDWLGDVTVAAVLCYPMAGESVARGLGLGTANRDASGDWRSGKAFGLS